MFLSESVSSWRTVLAGNTEIQVYRRLPGRLVPGGLWGDSKDNKQTTNDIEYSKQDVRLTCLGWLGIEPSRFAVCVCESFGALADPPRTPGNDCRKRSKSSSGGFCDDCLEGAKTTC